MRVNLHRMRRGTAFAAAMQGAAGWGEHPSTHEMSGNSAAVGPLGGPPPGMGKLAGSHSSGSSMLLLLLWHLCCSADRPDRTMTQPAQSSASQKLRAQGGGRGGERSLRRRCSRAHALRLAARSCILQDGVLHQRR